MRTTEKAAALLLILSVPCHSFVAAPGASRQGHHYSNLPTNLLLQDNRQHARRTCQMTANNDDNKERATGSFLSTASLQSFTKKIESLSKRLKEEPNEMLEEEASKLEIELRQEIKILTQKLDQAEADRAKDRELQKLMAKEQRALEKEIADLKKQYEQGTDWKYMYEEEKQRNEKREKESLAEIQRLEKEVRVVFSIGRRTSDKMVGDLGTRVKEKEEKLQMTMDELQSKKETIIDLEAERQSLRQLLRLSLRLTSQRLRLRLSLVRKKIMGGPLVPVGDATDGDKVKSRQAVQVRKSRRRSSGSSSS